METIQPQVLVVNYGSQYTKLITRQLRELNVRAAVLSPQRSNDWLQEHTPNAIILSGGNNSVHDKHAPALPERVFACEVPILGICYGMQRLAHEFGGEVASHTGHAEYGKAQVRLQENQLFTDIAGEQSVPRCDNCRL